MQMPSNFNYFIKIFFYELLNSINHFVKSSLKAATSITIPNILLTIDGERLNDNLEPRYPPTAAPTIWPNTFLSLVFSHETIKEIDKNIKILYLYIFHT